MQPDRRTVLWPRLAWGLGILQILGTPIWLTEHDPRGAVIGILVGLMLIAAGTSLQRGLRDGTVIATRVEMAGQSRLAWVIRPPASVIRAQLIFDLSAVALYGTILVFTGHLVWRVVGATGLVLFGIQLFDMWRRARTGDPPSLTLTADGLAARRRGRGSFAPWPTVEDARAIRSWPEPATTVRVRFSDPTVARSMRSVRSFVPLIRSPRWHLYWSVFGTGVGGTDLAEVVVRLGHDPAARAQVGTEHGMIILGITSPPAQRLP